MENSELIIRDANKGLVRTPRDVFAVGFRHSRLIAISFLGIFAGAVLVAALQPREYKAQMEILVKRERMDPVITTEAAPGIQFDSVVTPEEINSEVELLKTADLLKQVVVSCRLDSPRAGPAWARAIGRWGAKEPGTTAAGARIATAAQTLEKKLKISVIPNTNLISVSYESPDAQLSAQVLKTLARLYIEKHVAVHRPPGVFDFFHNEAGQYADQLTAAERRLVGFSHARGVVSAQIEKTAALEKLAEFRASLHQTQTQIAATKQRIQILEAQALTTPHQLTSQVVTSDNGLLLQQLKSSLLNLQLKRTELLTKFDPGYPLVREVDTEIAQAQGALAKAEAAPLHDVTTGRDPTYEWERGELVKAKDDLASLEAQASATASAIRWYEARAQFLGQAEVSQGDLQRAASAAEANYTLYRSKAEEARINDALDRRRIVNVAIAEAPSAPSLPANHRWLTVLMGGLLACVMSGGLAWGAECLDATFRTPDEVSLLLAVPVVASFPKGNGSGGGKGRLTA